MRPLALVVTCVLLLVGCGTSTGTPTGTSTGASTGTSTGTAADGTPTSSPTAGTVPITQRAVAAVALEHLPTDTRTREATYTDEDPRTGALGADLRYPSGDDQDDGDLLRVFLAPRSDADCTDQEGGSVAECATRDVDGGRLLLSWQTEEPEEDPGEVVVVLLRDDGSSVRVSWFGDVITGDPREQDLRIPVEVMEEVAQDPRLTLQTSPDVVALGEALDHWDGGEPDPHRHDRVPSTDEGILSSFLLAHGGYQSYHDGTPSPLKESWGPGALGSRVQRDGDDDHPAATIDILASATGPAWAGADPCAKYAVFYGGACRPKGKGRYIAWLPGPQGEVWMLAVRDDEVVAVHDTGFDVPATLPEVEVQADWFVVADLLLDDTLGLTTDTYVLDFHG